MPNSPEPTSPPPQAASASSATAPPAPTVLDYQPTWPADILPRRSPWKSSLLSNAVLLLALAVIVGVGIKLGTGYFPPASLQRICVDTAVAVSLAVSLQLIVGVGGVLSLGHVVFFAAALRVVPWLFNLCMIAIPGDSQVNITIGIFETPFLLIGSCVVAAALGLGLVAWLIARSTLAKSSVALPLITLAMAVLWEQSPWTDGRFYPYSILRQPGFFTAGLCALGIVAIVCRVMRSGIGLSVSAAREDALAAAAVGVDPDRHRMLCFILGSTLAAATGAVAALIDMPRHLARTPLLTSLELLAIVIIAGRRSISGVVITTILLTIARIYTPMELIGGFTPIYAIAALLILRFRPRGIFGEWEITDLFKARRVKETPA